MSDPVPSVPPPTTGPAPLFPTRVASREAQDDLTGATRLWLRRLPAGRRPQRLCEQFPRVANRVAWCWADATIREQTLDDLLEDRRGGRQGFPAPVVRELQRLREFCAQQAPAVPGPPWWRAMVKAVRN